MKGWISKENLRDLAIRKEFTITFIPADYYYAPPQPADWVEAELSLSEKANAILLGEGLPAPEGETVLFAT